MRGPAKSLDKESPIQGPWADSEEKYEPVSDIDAVAVDSLKVLDSKPPIREADISDARSKRPKWLSSEVKGAFHQVSPLSRQPVARPVRYSVMAPNHRLTRSSIQRRLGGATAEGRLVCRRSLRRRTGRSTRREVLNSAATSNCAARRSQAEAVAPNTPCKFRGSAGKTSCGVLTAR